jgi:hypothetical protein
VAAATTLEALVSAPLRKLLWAAVAGAACMAAQGATQVLVISGLGGEAEYEQRFLEWSQGVAKASATATGDAARVVRLSGSDATREAIEQQLKKVAEQLKGGDQFVLVLLGHGSFDGNEYRFNIPGPDITGSQILALLDRIPESVAQLAVVATSTSGAVADRWAKGNRVVITATKNGGERNAVRFGSYWTEALTSDEADKDKDGSVTAQEAYDYAVRKVSDAFKSDAAIASEHAKLVGADPARFVVARLGSAALFASDTQLIALRDQQAGIERRLDEVRALKPQLTQDQYYDRLEPVLVDLARLGARVDARLATLGVKDPGGARATP